MQFTRTPSEATFVNINRVLDLESGTVKMSSEEIKEIL